MPTSAVAVRADPPGMCVICLSELEPGDCVKTLACSHTFHAGCVYTWARTRVSCPTCRFASACACDLDRAPAGGLVARCQREVDGPDHALRRRAVHVLACQLTRRMHRTSVVPLIEPRLDDWLAPDDTALCVEALLRKICAALTSLTSVEGQVKAAQL